MIDENIYIAINYWRVNCRQRDEKQLKTFVNNLNAKKIGAWVDYQIILDQYPLKKEEFSHQEYLLIRHKI